MLPGQVGRALTGVVPCAGAGDMGHGGTLDQRTNLTQILSEWTPVQTKVTALNIANTASRAVTATPSAAV